MSNEIATTLESLAEKQYDEWREKAAEAGIEIALDADFENALKRVFEASEYVFRHAVRYPELLSEMIDSGALSTPYQPGEMAQQLRLLLAEVADEAGLQRELRRFRRRQMIRIIWRDLTRWAELDETLEDLSALADACVDQALEKLYGWLTEQFSTPMGADSGEPQRLVVLGMGKLGARELNLSSDIDLIFAFEEGGETNGRRPQANELFFTRLCQKLIQALDNNTVDGFVFRTDARLRPYGDSGPMACSFDFMEEYYQSQAREWERYAMIKARVVAGDFEAGKRLSAMLRPFVYRRYLDFGAIESIRTMKQLISKELHKKGMDANVKLGPGGIREIEFIGQAFQLIRGGRDPELQIRPILKVLRLLEERGLLPPETVQELSEAYEFLRLVENRVQAWRDEQTHLLPTDDEGRMRLARSMAFNDWESFVEVLARHRDHVQIHFDQVFSVSQEEVKEEPSPLASVWKGVVDDEQGVAVLNNYGYHNPLRVLSDLAAFRESSAMRGQGEKGRERMEQLMPLVLEAAGKSAEADTTLERLLGLLEAVARRTAYLALLAESPVALGQLVRLAGESIWIANMLKRHPLLLDELLDPRRLYTPLHRDNLERELDILLEPVEEDDLEQQMDRLRQFSQSNMLRVAAADISGVIPLMVVSDYLTDIASVVSERVLRQSWGDLVRKHGRPTGMLGDETGFAIIGYGKLGGIELGYGSDLDLVFLHGSRDMNAMTDGEKTVSNDVFFARLGQRIVHMYTTRTPAGMLYEVDMRLRPNGNSGLLVSSLNAFEGYQNEDAWTWEHQALVRARPVAGDPAVIAEFQRIRRDILCKERDEVTLRADVREMREKMRQQLDKSDERWFDVKQGRGGIADIEFMVQYAVLRWANKFPDLADWTDNVRLLETLVRHELLQGKSAELLSGAYKVFRAVYHRHALQERPGLVNKGVLEEESRMVTEIWQDLLVE